MSLYYERKRVMRALDQLSVHSPTWVKLIREYIAKVEKAAKR